MKGVELRAASVRQSIPPCFQGSKTSSSTAIVGIPYFLHPLISDNYFYGTVCRTVCRTVCGSFLEQDVAAIG